MPTATIIGLAAATCTTICLIPQVSKILKTKHTKDLSLSMYIIFIIGIALWLTYGILINDLPIIVANSITIILGATILAMKLKYK